MPPKKKTKKSRETVAQSENLDSALENLNNLAGGANGLLVDYLLDVARQEEQSQSREQKRPRKKNAETTLSEQQLANDQPSTSFGASRESIPEPFELANRSNYEEDLNEEVAEEVAWGRNQVLHLRERAPLMPRNRHAFFERPQKDQSETAEIIDDIERTWTRTSGWNLMDEENDDTDEETEEIMAEFSETTGTNADLFKGKKSPTEFFFEMLGGQNQFLNALVNNTNKNALLLCKGKQYVEITKNEMMSFLGLQLFFGYHRLPLIRDYWCSAEDLFVPLVRNAMQLERLKYISRKLFITDPTFKVEESTEKLWTLRPLIATLNKTFMNFRLPEQWQNIAESKVRITDVNSLDDIDVSKKEGDKRIRDDLRMWCRSDDTGYTYEFEVQLIKNADDAVLNYEVEREKVARRMTRSLVGKNCKVAFGPHFVSARLLKNLRNDGIFACGKVYRPDAQELPSLRSEKELAVGESDFIFSNDRIGYFVWKGNSATRLLTNFHGSEVESIAFGVEREQIPCPKAVKDHITYAMGVAKADTLRTVYERNRVTSVAWHRLFYLLLETALVNSHICYNDCVRQGVIEDGEVLTLLKFKRRVANGLLTMGRVQSDMPVNIKPNKRRRQEKLTVPADRRLLGHGVHWPVWRSNIRPHKCEWCMAKYNRDIRSNIECEWCGVFLCIKSGRNCFYEYHGKTEAIEEAQPDDVACDDD